MGEVERVLGLALQTPLQLPNLVSRVRLRLRASGLFEFEARVQGFGSYLVSRA